MKYKNATFDIETDPFLYGRVPEPFLCGLSVEGEETLTWWNKSCLEQFYNHLQQRSDKLRIYAHNGGKFDFMYLLRMGIIERDVKIIHGRIVEATIEKHQLRDSYAILPFALDGKFSIDYTKFESNLREKHKDEITRYLIQDCERLLELVTYFIELFGPKLTIGGASMSELRKRHKFTKINKSLDEPLRKYYFGGRVQAFETGVIRAPLKYYDVNSMYPFVMAHKYHFCSTEGYYSAMSRLDAFDTETGAYGGDIDQPYFLSFKGVNRGVAPTRTKEGLTFNVEYGHFDITHHEAQLALKHGLIEIHEITELIVSCSKICFSDFVYDFIRMKDQGTRTGDKDQRLMAKFILNSAYGKTAQNPENFSDYRIVDERDVNDLLVQDWIIHTDYPDFGLMLMERPVKDNGTAWYDVGIGASITGAARSVLLDALIHSKRPIYCDTDSIICEGIEGIDVDTVRLGAWDIEAEGDSIAVAGKKLYALSQAGQCVKLASKGVQLSAIEIRRLAMGDTVIHAKDAPTFKLEGKTLFQLRMLGAGKHSRLYNKYGERIQSASLK